MNLHAKHGSLGCAFALLALLALYFGAYFAWITADPPVGMPDGTSRHHTPEELGTASTYANVSFTILLIAVAASIYNVVRWVRGARADNR
jgi:hypothetical protein